MKTVIIGSGGREHALALQISKSESLTELYCIPGNPGTESIAKNISIDIKSHDEVLDFVNENKIELVVIGPEQPLVDGLGDFLRANNIKVFGPDKKAAQIEGDKSFSKNLMQKYNIPTAAFKVFDKTEKENALEYIKNSNMPIVIKAAGLAAGKGVLICNNLDETIEAIEECFDKSAFGKAGNKIVIEEFMQGQEASLFAISDGTDFISLPVAQDHKRIGNGDTGKNTGGMGAYAPAPLVDDKLKKEIEDKIVKPTLEAMKSEGFPFVGCLYCGLMITEEGPKVVEFNCRFGDPETQAVLPLLNGDFLQLLYSAAAGSIDKETVKYNGGSAVCVIAASDGYPGSYKKGLEIFGVNGIKLDDKIIIHHAGTKRDNNKLVTSGGRVLGVTSVIEENDLKKAKELAYEGMLKICFEGMYYRKDISDKAF